MIFFSMVNINYIKKFHSNSVLQTPRGKEAIRVFFSVKKLPSALKFTKML